MSRYTIKTFYSFTDLPVTQLEVIRDRLQKRAVEGQILGLVILGKEGLNTTLAAQHAYQLDTFIEDIIAHLELENVSMIKTSYSEKRPFRRFDVKIRSEIVTLEREHFVPKGPRSHLSPQDWNKYLDRVDVVVIDTRNKYEIEIGKFQKALDLEIDEFTDFSEKVKSLDTDRSKPHLIYCTGGIRCEKAIFEMEAQGFSNVFQLDGGILNYLEQCPDQKFEGECFVFDSRVAVDQQLNPSEKYSLCPHCGDVSSTEIVCLKCDHPAKLCPKCFTQSTHIRDLQTCSKNCRHHYKIQPQRKGPRQKQFFHE